MGYVSARWTTDSLNRLDGQKLLISGLALEGGSVGYLIPCQWTTSAHELGQGYAAIVHEKREGCLRLLSLCSF